MVFSVVALWLPTIGAVLGIVEPRAPRMNRAAIKTPQKRPDASTGADPTTDLDLP
jgi:hypothetical protein